VRERTADRPNLTGADVRTATSGREALRLLEDHPVGPVVADISIPDGDGNRLIAQMRPSPNLRQMAVVIMSAHAESESTGARLQAGADNFVVKPLDSARLLVTAGRYLHPPPRNIPARQARV